MFIMPLGSIVNLEGSNAVPLKGEPSASQAFLNMSCVFWNKTTETGIKVIKNAVKPHISSMSCYSTTISS